MNDFYVKQCFSAFSGCFYTEIFSKFWGLKFSSTLSMYILLNLNIFTSISKFACKIIVKKVFATQRLKTTVFDIKDVVFASFVIGSNWLERIYLCSSKKWLESCVFPSKQTFSAWKTFLKRKNTFRMKRHLQLWKRLEYKSKQLYFSAGNSFNKATHLHVKIE